MLTSVNSISLVSTTAQVLWDLKNPIGITSLTLGVALPVILSSSFMGFFSDAHEHYSWQPFARSDKEAPGIFDDPQEVEQGAPLKDQRGLFLFIFHRYVAFFRDTYTQMVTKYEAFLDWKGSPSETYIDPSIDQDFHWKENSSGLYVFIHGIHGHPSCWNAYKKTIKTQDPHADVCLIKVKNGGDCSLEEAAEPIFRLLKNYSKKHHANPIALIGTSRGAPITASLELKMRKLAHGPKVYVGTIAGAHHGSLMMTLLKTIGCAHLWFSREVVNELSYKSNCATKLLDQQKTGLIVDRKFRSYCTTEEFQIQPCISSFPRLQIEKTGSSKMVSEEHFYIHGSGHLSIVDRVQPHILDDLFKWMGKNGSSASFK